MTKRSKDVTEVTLTERETEIIRQQKLIEHARHQQRIGTMTRMRKQEVSHARYGVRLQHYLKSPQELTTSRWVTELRAFDVRAYQSKLADINIGDHEAYMWWFRLGDEQRYSLVRSSIEAIRDENEQEEKYARIKSRKNLREMGEA